MPKSNRRSTPFGAIISSPGTAKRFLQYADSIHVRELSFGSGGIGCGLWNASIILSKFILENPDVFMGKTVHEVGAGVGLPILYASMFANKAIYSDFMTPLIDNFKYNVECNVNQLQVDTAFNSTLHQINTQMDSIQSSKLTDQQQIALDAFWDVVYHNQTSVEKRFEDEDNYIVSAQPEIDYPMIDVRSKLVEYQAKVDPLPSITQFEASTCLSHSPTCGCVGYTPPSNYNTFNYQTHRDEISHHRSQCLLNMQRSTHAMLLDWFNFNTMPAPLKESLKSDIILGSEVCYPTILDALPSLATLIHQTLSDTGVFYLIQSPNRGTSLYFIETLCASLGLLLDMRVVDLDILIPFSSGQRDESYVYYTFRRPGSPFPIMGFDNDYVAPVDGLSEASMKLINTNKDKRGPNGSIIPASEIVFDMKLAEPTTKQRSEGEEETTVPEKTTDTVVLTNI